MGELPVAQHLDSLATAFGIGSVLDSQCALGIFKVGVGRAVCERYGGDVHRHLFARLCRAGKVYEQAESIISFAEREAFRRQDGEGIISNRRFAYLLVAIEQRGFGYPRVGSIGGEGERGGHERRLRMLSLERESKGFHGCTACRGRRCRLADSSRLHYHGLRHKLTQCRLETLALIVGRRSLAPQIDREGTALRRTMQDKTVQLLGLNYIQQAIGNRFHTVIDRQDVLIAHTHGRRGIENADIAHVNSHLAAESSREECIGTLKIVGYLSLRSPIVIEQDGLRDRQLLLAVRHQHHSGYGLRGSRAGQGENAL